MSSNIELADYDKITAHFYRVNQSSSVRKFKCVVALENIRRLVLILLTNILLTC